jgi:protein-disulfide isomerase
MLLPVLDRLARIGASLLLLATLGACGNEAYQSAAADVSGKDPRRLPPDRKEDLPDVMLETADRGRVLAADSARIRLFVVSDYQCAACRTWFETTLPQVRRDYVETGKVKLIWTQYPLREHAGALRAASGATCASVQGDFWGASERLFAAQDRWGAANVDTLLIDSIARGSVVDRYSFALCQSGGRVHRLIRRDIDFVDAMRAGAPLTLIVGLRVVPGTASLATLRSVLDSAIAASK